MRTMWEFTCNSPYNLNITGKPNNNHRLFMLTKRGVLDLMC